MSAGDPGTTDTHDDGGSGDAQESEQRVIVMCGELLLFCDADLSVTVSVYLIDWYGCGNFLLLRRFHPGSI